MADVSSERSAWFAAVRGGEAAAVRELLRRGADPAWRDPSVGSDNETALHDAASLGHCAVIELLLSAGADVNVRSASGWTPLMRACNTGKLAAARLLLAAGADTDARNDEGYTAYGRVPGTCDELLALLRQRGAAL
jgi:ankyrin repeat protein